MNAMTMQVDVPSDVFYALNETPAEFVGYMRLVTAQRLFETGRLSLGKAAELAGMEMGRFREELFEMKISVMNYPANELSADLDRMPCGNCAV